MGQRVRNATRPAALAVVTWYAVGDAGHLPGKPVELVRCETIDVTVPATSEIVIEGELVPGKRRMEGPFGEFPGYYQGIA